MNALTPRRRRFARLLAVALLGAVALPITPAAEVLPEHGRALSLRVLQDRAQRCQRSRDCEPAVHHLAFLRRIDGFVIDREHQDVVLIGQVDPAWPALHLQHLVIAMRDAWHRYARRSGNTLYLADPGVSIDPHARVIARLQQVGARLDALSGRQLEHGLEAWHNACHLPQKVRVEGIPFDTRFAAVMLEVDYDLKRLASASLEIEGLTSLSGRYLAMAKKALASGTAPRLSSMSRFWFTPRELVVRADADAALIDPGFGLKVLTEEEFLNGHGQIVGHGNAAPLAAEFARAVTKFYPQIAARRPAWREMENLAWMVALARTLRHRGATEAATLDIDWLLDHFAMPRTAVPRNVPGHSNVHAYDYRQAVRGGYVVGSLTLPSCGGVTMAVRIDDDTFAPPDRTLRTAARLATSTRPKQDLLYWDF